MSVHSSLFYQNNSHFLRLPAEIRNMVYAYALGGNTWSMKTTQHPAGAFKARAENGVKHALSLLRVNRQIYAEAYLFPYLYNTFAGVHNGHLHEWVKSLTDTQRTSIKTIKRYHSGYVIYITDSQGVSISPGFWMDMPRIADWGLDGLKQIDVEVTLRKWGWDTDKDDMKRVLEESMTKLRKLVEFGHPGVVVDVFLQRRY
ncbi:uncharacterized protein M421DRAFT_2041 [Didymella exigua CBS 183.55]|uniref:DUF7730 domain-containing protein n=1 Tax=Didymella exigua CBS 183.55 TaxID=1150837 RepID=A0A6A5RX40_9PLEO|nr:uncharacterized protein M421DRAFT_2041 [Didymella exigua CBS 183.55]KAF1932412.1 hypothetical protein M421DRAFT_2041 [Didymella exigua CBS 183.55]